MRVPESNPIAAESAARTLSPSRKRAATKKSAAPKTADMRTRQATPATVELALHARDLAPGVHSAAPLKRQNAYRPEQWAAALASFHDAEPKPVLRRMNALRPEGWREVRCALDAEVRESSASASLSAKPKLKSALKKGPGKKNPGVVFAPGVAPGDVEKSSRPRPGLTEKQLEKRFASSEDGQKTANRLATEDFHGYNDDLTRPAGESTRHKQFLRMAVDDKWKQNDSTLLEHFDRPEIEAELRADPDRHRGS